MDRHNDRVSLLRGEMASSGDASTQNCSANSGNNNNNDDDDESIRRAGSTRNGNSLSSGVHNGTRGMSSLRPRGLDRPYVVPMVDDDALLSHTSSSTALKSDASSTSPSAATS